jgi:hypothetical protein
MSRRGDKCRKRLGSAIVGDQYDVIHEALMVYVILVRFFGGFSVYGPFQNLREAEGFITDNTKARGLLTQINSWEVLPLRPKFELVKVDERPENNSPAN